MRELAAAVSAAVAVFSLKSGRHTSLGGLIGGGKVIGLIVKEGGGLMVKWGGEAF